MPLLVILTQSKGPSVPMEPTTTKRVDVGVIMDFEMGEKIEAPDMSTQVMGLQPYPLQFQLSLRIQLGHLYYPLPLYYIVASGMVFVSHEFLQSVVHN